MGNRIELVINSEHILRSSVDVISLRYDGSFTGAEWAIINDLERSGLSQENLCPDIDSFEIIWKQKVTTAQHILIVGSGDVAQAGYSQLQRFSIGVMRILKTEMPNSNRLALILPSSEKGLDEIEAFKAIFSGLIEALINDRYSQALNTILVVSDDANKVERVRQYFENRVVDNKAVLKVNSFYFVDVPGLKAIDSYRSFINQDYSKKSTVFVALPFTEEMEDVYYYGIQGAVHAAGLICERVDQDVFIGDIVDQIKKKIDMSRLIIAVLDGGNPNVYLELGYAWGKNKPTVLIANSAKELHFDVRGQRCLLYKSIRGLEEKLSGELKALKGEGIV